MMLKINADNLAHSNSDSRGIAGRGVAMQATRRDLSKIKCHYCNKFGHYKNDCADFKAAHHQNRRRRQRHHKQRGGHQPDQPKPGRQQQQRGRGKMWCSNHKTTTRSDSDCRTRSANRPNGNAHFAQVRPPRVPGICSSWDLSVRDESDEKPCISFLAREVQPTAKPAKARVEEEKGALPFGSVGTAATEGWRTRPWPFTPRADPQPATKPAKAQVAEEKGPRPFDPVLTAATEGWRTRPWPFTPRPEQAISFGGPVAEETSNLCYTFGMANDDGPIKKALMASSSVAVISEDSVNSNLATLMAPAKPLPGEVRESLSRGASTPSKGRASPETARPSPAPVPATARRGATMRDNRIHRPNVVTRRAAVELTGVVTRYRGVRPNKNNSDDDNNNNLAALTERFQLIRLHKLRQLGCYTNTDTLDTAHQLDAEVVPAKVPYTGTNTQPSCSGGGESDRVPETFKEAMGLPQVAYWKTVSDKEVASPEKHGAFNLVPITLVPAGHKIVGTRWVLKIEADNTYNSRLVVQGVPQIPDMSVTRDREKETITVSQKGYTEDVVQPYGMEGCNPGVGPELYLNQPEEKLLNEVEKRRYQVILEPYMYIA